MPVGTNPLTVLVVDDSTAVRSRMCALLAEWPRLQVVADTGDGLEAILLFERCRPSAVVLDIQLPGLTGVEILGRIKTVSPDCKVVMLTSFHQPRLREVCKILGADAFFNKSLEFECVPKYLDSLAAPASVPTY